MVLFFDVTKRLVEESLFIIFFQPHEGISALQVSIEKTTGEEGPQEEIIIWQLTNIQLDFWETGRVHIASPEDFTILIKVIY